MDSYSKLISIFSIFITLLIINTFGQDSNLPVDVIYNSKTNVFIINNTTNIDHSSSNFESWRFVYNEKILIVEPFYSGGITYTSYSIVECKTFDIMTNEIYGNLKLELTEDQIINISNITNIDLLPFPPAPPPPIP